MRDPQHCRGQRCQARSQYRQVRHANPFDTTLTRRFAPSSPTTGEASRRSKPTDEGQMSRTLQLRADRRQIRRWDSAGAQNSRIDQRVGHLQLDDGSHSEDDSSGIDSATVHNDAHPVRSFADCEKQRGKPCRRQSRSGIVELRVWCLLGGSAGDRTNHDQNGGGQEHCREDECGTVSKDRTANSGQRIPRTEADGDVTDRPRCLPAPCPGRRVGARAQESPGRRRTRGPDARPIPNIQKDGAAAAMIED